MRKNKEDGLFMRAVLSSYLLLLTSYLIHEVTPSDVASAVKMLMMI